MIIWIIIKPNISEFTSKYLFFRISSLYHHIKPLIYKKVIAMNKLDQFQEKLHTSRLLLIKAFHQCLIHLTNQISNKK